MDTVRNAAAISAGLGLSQQKYLSDPFGALDLRQHPNSAVGHQHFEYHLFQQTAPVPLSWLTASTLPLQVQSLSLAKCPATD